MPISKRARGEEEAMKRLHSRASVALALTCIAVSSPVFADLIQIGASKDNTLYQDPSGGLSNALGQYTFAGKTSFSQIRRAVMAFDVASSIPSGSTINSVSLTLYMSKSISGDVPTSLHRVSANWGEGTSMAFGEEGSGGTATTGDATWTHRFSPTLAWTTVGGDFAATASATQTVGDIGYYTWGSSAQMVTDVQGWLTSPASNFGWLLKGDESGPSTAKRFDSRENEDPAVRPVLTITYTVPEPSTLGLLMLAFCVAARKRLRQSI